MGRVTFLSDHFDYKFLICLGNDNGPNANGNGNDNGNQNSGVGNGNINGNDNQGDGNGNINGNEWVIHEQFLIIIIYVKVIK